MLLGRSLPNNYAFIGSFDSLLKRMTPKMSDLACFYPGNLALGYMFLSKTSLPSRELDDIYRLATDLMETCYQTYARTATGLGPEQISFNSIDPNQDDFTNLDLVPTYVLHAVTIESLYYVYKLTRDKTYQDYGWRIFEAIENYTRISTGGFSTIGDVNNPRNVKYGDLQPTHLLSAVLKFLYLLFEEDDQENIDINKWLFNSIGHLISIF